MYDFKLAVSLTRILLDAVQKTCVWTTDIQGRSQTLYTAPCNGIVKRVTLVYLDHVNRSGHHKKLSIAKLDFVQVCGLLLSFYNKTLRKFYKFSDSRET